MEITKGEPELFTNLYIKDLSSSVDEKKLRKSFEIFGEISSCLVVTEKDEKARKYAFLNFTLPESAKKAVDTLNGKITEGVSIEGKPLYVGKAEKKRNSHPKIERRIRKKKSKRILSNIKV